MNRLKLVWENYNPDKYFPNTKHLVFENKVLMKIFWEIGNIDGDIAGCMDTFVRHGKFTEGNKKIFYACYDTLKVLKRELKVYKPSNDVEKVSYTEMKKYVDYVLSIAEKFKETDKHQ